MDGVATDDPAWRLGLERRAGAAAAVLEAAAGAGVRLRLLVLPGGGEVVVEVVGLDWPLDPEQTHPVVLRLPTEARWPAHLRLVGRQTVQVAAPLPGSRLLAALQGARWLRLEHREHRLVLALPPRHAIAALQALACGGRDEGGPGAAMTLHRGGAGP